MSDNDINIYDAIHRLNFLVCNHLVAQQVLLKKLGIDEDEFLKSVREAMKELDKKYS